MIKQMKKDESNTTKFRKKLLSIALAVTMVTSALPFSVLATPADDAPSGQETFYSSFETTDPEINPTMVSSEGLRHTVTTTSTVTEASGEYTNFAGIPTISPEYTGSSDEGLDKLIDQNTGTKLCLSGSKDHPGNNSYVKCPFSITFEYDKPITPEAYYIAGANDDIQYSSRVLNSWTIEGSNNKENWVELDSRKSVVWTSNKQVQNFAVSKNLGSYKYIRLNVLKRGTGSGTTNGGTIQFSGFGMYADATIEGVDSSTEQDGFGFTAGKGPAELWGNTSSRANLGWTGDQALLVHGVKNEESANASYKIYDGLDVDIHPNTKLSYMVMPYINEDIQSNIYDYEYTSNYTSIDLEFDDGTYLSDYDAVDQYGFKVSPRGQAEAGIIESNNWLKVTSEIGSIPELQGKKIKAILVGYDKPDGTPGKEVNIYYDDVEIYREDNPIITNLADYVNILRGTQNGTYGEDHNKHAHGLNNPIVSTPHPFNFWSPATTMSAATLYQYTGSEANFKQIEVNHVASNWTAESGTFDFSADSTTEWSNENALASDLKSRGSDFKHENEIAHAYYYGVTFNEDDETAPGVKIEVTPTEHAAILRFTFPEGSDQRNVILDCTKARNSSSAGITYNEDGSFLAFSSKVAAGQKRMYVYGEFSVMPTSFHACTGNNKPLSMFQFPAAQEGDTVVELRVATSYISGEQAEKNLNLEITEDDNFDSIKEKALNIWNEKLSVIEVEDPNATYDQLVSLYSNMYRAFIYPMLDSENTNTNEEPRWQFNSPYQGNSTSLNLEDGRLFYANGFWDTYRSAWPLYSLLTPEKDTDLLNGLVQHYKECGWIPRWVQPTGINSMVGTNSDSVFGDAISQGVEFDYANAYASALKNATVYSPNNGDNFYSGRAGMAEWPFLGYSPTNSLMDENLSWSLEAGIADFAISSIAKAMRDMEEPGTESYRKLNDEYLYFINRAQNYSYLFNPSLGGWFRGKTADGRWLWSDEDFNPIAMGYGYTEDNAWNYAFHAPQDGRGLANLYGGPDKLGDKLDEMLATQGTDFGNWGGWHKEKVEVRGDKLGQLHMSNEPAFHIPYMYLFTDRPWKTAEVVRTLLDRHFAGSDIGQGYIGDEDNGAMASWYVLSALGIYPLTNGNGQYVFGTPLFQKVIINRDNGDQITINAPGVSRTNKYVQSVYVNGDESYDKTYIDPSDIHDGTTIDFTMGSTPSETWGIGADVQPTSVTQDDNAPSPLRDLTESVMPSATDIPSGYENGAYANATNAVSLFNNTSADHASWEAGDKMAIYYFYPGAQIDMYTITSWTSDTAPSQWILSGSMDGQSWTELDVRTNQTFEWDRYTRPFSIENPGTYKYYKFEFTNPDEETELSELELMGSEFALVNKDALLQAILKGQSIDSSLYAEETYLPVVDAVEFAQGVYDNKDATTDEIKEAIDGIESAIDGLIAIKPAQIELEAVTCEIASSTVKKETTPNVSGVVSGDITNLGGLTPGSYVGFQYVDFGDGDYWWTNAKITYAGKQADLKDSRVVVHLDALDGPVIADFGLEATGPNWDVYASASGELAQNNITGLHTVYYEFRGSGISVANVHSFVFEYTTLPDLGKIINTFTPDSLTTALKYQNQTSGIQNLTLHTAVYAQDGKLVYTANSAREIAPSEIVDFETVISQEGIQTECLLNNYFIGVFLWDSVTGAPIQEKYRQAASAINMDQALSEAKEAIEAGTYKIPDDITTQEEKTSWVQEAVSARIPDGNLTVATVSYEDGRYVVNLVNGSARDTAHIDVTQQIIVTFSASEADESYLVTAEADAFGTVSLPEDPVRTNYQFLGWYMKQDDGDWRFTENTVVTGSTTVYAKWASAPSNTTYASIVFDNPVKENDLTMIDYSTDANSEAGAKVEQFRGDVAGKIDYQGTSYKVGRFMYLHMPTDFPALRDETDIIFEITYYDIGTTPITFETANTTKTGTERDFGNRHNIPRSNTGELVTYQLYLNNVGMRRGQNNSCDLRINGGGSGPNMYIKSVVIWAGTEPSIDSIPAPTFAPQTEQNNLIGKTLAGYQMWFTSSPTNSGWVHWSNNKRPTEYGTIKFENYPDVREYPDSVLNETGLPDLPDGTPSKLFTSKNKEVVDLHFSWIDQYGMDGVAVQRFTGETVPSETPTRNHINLVQDAAEKYGKTFYVMYDFTGTSNQSDTIANKIKRDWIYSIEQKGIVSSPSYAHADGKPVVCLWGLSGVVSESDGNTYIRKDPALEIINWFKDRGYYIIGGTPDNDWTERTDGYEQVYQSLDMISPWTPGRYGRSLDDIVPWLDAHVPRELAYCEKYGIEYQPVMFAGFNWSSFQPYPPNEIPREAGEMLWTQAKYLKNKGIDTAYFAMFDEYDEGTALMKTAEDSYMLPVGEKPYFQTLAADGRWLSSDFYLRLAGAVIDLFQNDDASISMDAPVPIAYSEGPVYWRNSFERRYQEPNSGGYEGGYNNVDVCLYKPEVLESKDVSGTKNEMLQGTGHFGSFCFHFGGTSSSDSSVYQYKIAETAILAPKDLQLSYWIKAESTLGKSVYVDLQFEDGSLLSEKPGFIQKKAASADGWDQITVDLDSSLIGQNITAVVVSYAGGEGDFEANIDDIVIQIKQ